MVEFGRRVTGRIKKKMLYKRFFSRFIKIRSEEKRMFSQAKKSESLKGIIAFESVICVQRSQIMHKLMSIEVEL